MQQFFNNAILLIANHPIEAVVITGIAGAIICGIKKSLK